MINHGSRLNSGKSKRNLTQLALSKYHPKNSMRRDTIAVPPCTSSVNNTSIKGDCGGNKGIL